MQALLSGTPKPRGRYLRLYVTGNQLEIAKAHAKEMRKDGQTKWTYRDSIEAAIGEGLEIAEEQLREAEAMKENN